MHEETKLMQNYGFIEVNGVRHDFENIVSGTFDGAINHFLMRQGLTKEPILNGNNLNAQVANGFSLIAETPVAGNLKLYTELGFLPMTAFEVQGVDFKMTRLRGAAISSNNGTVRGGGFNIITKNRKSPLTTVPFTRRKINIAVSTFYSIPDYSNWFYHYGNKAFYYFENAGKVNKIAWDYETGLWGAHTITTTGFTYISSIQDKFTDGDNRLFAFSSANQMRIYDFPTDTFTTVTMTASFSQTSNIYRFIGGWDTVAGGLKCVQSGYLTTASNGFVIKPDGTVIKDTGILPLPNYQYNPVLFEQDFLWVPMSSDSFNGSLVPSDDVNFNAVGLIGNMYGDGEQPYNHVAKMRYCPRNGNKFIFADFNSTTPTSITINFCSRTENYTTVLGVNAIPVEIGDSLVIEYTFRSGT